MKEAANTWQLLIYGILKSFVKDATPTSYIALTIFFITHSHHLAVQFTASFLMKEVPFRVFNS